MKKLFVMLCAAVALFACQKVQPVTVEVTPEEIPSTPMTFNLSVSHADADATKALKSGWESGDVVYVFFKDIAQKYLKLSYDGTSWTLAECNTEDGGPKFTEDDFNGVDKLMTAVYIPHYDVKVTWSSGFNFTDASGGLFFTYYMFAEAVPYEVSGTTVSGTLAMEKPENVVQFFVPGISEADAPLYRLREVNLQPVGCCGVLLDGTCERLLSNIGRSLKGFFYSNGTDSGVLFAGKLTSAGTPTDYAFQLVKYVSATKACAEGTYEAKATAKTINAGAVVRFPETTNTSAWTYGKWVDMGAAGRWATGNLTDDNGTTKGEANIVAPDAPGKYYAWAGTVGHVPDGSTFDPPYWGDSTVEFVKYKGHKYQEPDLLILEANDDAATVNLGNGWRMPTREECAIMVKEDETDFAWDWPDSGYANPGSLVTCKATGLTMFLPAVGYIKNQNLFKGRPDGCYWTSTHRYSVEVVTNVFAISFTFCDGDRFVTAELRSFGLFVRAVKD